MSTSANSALCSTQTTLNDLSSLARGQLHLTRNKTELTILLIGSIGVGKTTMVSFIANVLGGRSPERYKDIRDPKNEVRGQATHSQTNAAQLYVVRSRSGVTVRILDTPGLADTRGLAQDERHKKSIVDYIRRYITVVNAIIILANSTAPRLGVASDYAITTLLSILPRTFSGNTCIVFTHASSHHSWNFDETSLPEVPRYANRFRIDNPFAIQKEYKDARENGASPNIVEELRHRVQNGERKALEVLVGLLDWLDGLSPQPTNDIMTLYEQSQNIEKSIVNVLECMKHDTVQTPHENQPIVTDANTADMKDTDEAIKVLGNLINQYSLLSLSGSFLGQVEKLVKWLELSMEMMIQQNVSSGDAISVVHRILKNAVEKLNVLRKASQILAPNPPELSDVAALAKGVLHLNSNKKEMTILVVGETGVGKTTIVSLIANVLRGRSPEQYQDAHDPNNEAGGSAKQSQTNAAKLYTFRSRNDITIHILDTPGLPDTRGLAQDARHKKSIAETISRYITTVNAVIILANGTVPRLGVATDYALTTLSSIFPRTLANNIGIMFTNVSSPLSWNFDEKYLPDVVKDANRFLIDNPVAIQKKYENIKDKGVIPPDGIEQLRCGVQNCEQEALKVLVELFNWLDGLSPQPTKEIWTLYEQSQDIDKRVTQTLAYINEAAQKKQELQHIIADVNKADVDINRWRNFQRVIQYQGNRQIVIDYSAKANFESAQTRKAERQKSMAVVQIAIDGFEKKIKESIDELGSLAYQYSQLSLSGNFSGQVEKSITLLEMNRETMRQNGSDWDTISKIEQSLKGLEERLYVLKKADKARSN